MRCDVITNDRKPLRFLSVCSGIEAASQALHRHGFECAAVSEIEPHPCAVLAHRFGASRPWNMPDPAAATNEKDRKARAAAIKAMQGIPSGNQIPNFGDMSRFQEWPDADYDALFGGTPCQSFSVAGLRAGLDDPRGNLMLTFGAIAARFRPRWITWENVPGVLSSNDGRDFASLLGLLSGRSITPPAEGWQNSGIVPGIADAYGLAWGVLDAQHVRTSRFRRAVPQRRRRVFVVGYSGDWRRAAAVLLDAESLRRDPPPSRSAGERVAPTISARPTGGGGLGTDFDLDGGVICAEVTTSLDASMGRLQGASGQDANHGHSTLVAMSSGQANAEITEGHAPSLTCLHEAPIIVQEARRPSRGEGQPAQTTWKVRRLTPDECEFLQGMPRGMTNIPWRGKGFSPDGNRYKELGNSWALNSIDWIGERMAIVDGWDL